MLVLSTAGHVADYALAFFLVAAGIGVAVALALLAGLMQRISSFIKGAETEIMPVINKVGGSVDRVNGQLDKLDTVTDSAVDAVQSVDGTVRTVSFAVRRPVEKLVGLTSGVSHGFATLKAKRSVGAAMESAKEAASRREADFRDEIGKTDPASAQSGPQAGQ
ncbi:MAG TPA: hypothetical protein VG265_10605 [Gaiellaceae bacterium]|jgi:uncharacterized protein YoxC|nr:hypothetical protein [Gaiellaceae bacterium]